MIINTWQNVGDIQFLVYASIRGLAEITAIVDCLHVVAVRVDLLDFGRGSIHFLAAELLKFAILQFVQLRVHTDLAPADA